MHAYMLMHICKTRFFTKAVSEYINIAVGVQARNTEWN